MSQLKATEAFINQFSADPKERSDAHVFLSQQLLFSCLCYEEEMGVLLHKSVCASLLLAGDRALQTDRKEGQK